MLTAALQSLSRVLLLIALTVALTSTGFAHRMPSSQDQALAFALANGAQASDFCGGASGQDRAATLHCPACQISASVDLPKLASVQVDLELALHGYGVVPRPGPVLWSVRDPAHGPQGPPVA